jgi:hypothetical protein
VIIEVARPNETASTVKQHFYSVVDDDKRRALKHLILKNGITQAFVFVNSKLGCARLARSLEHDGLKTSALHGDKSQDERLKALDAFKSGEVDLLICTDVAARGLDIKDVPAVFNFDVPYNAEDYVHRIGRTGRAGASGLAISFVSATDTKLIGDIEKLIKVKVELESVEFDDGFSSRSRDVNGDTRGFRESSDSRHRRSPRENFDHAHKSTGTSSFGHRSYEKKPVPIDPFFDKPYEPSAAPEQLPSWEASDKPTSRSISANIKPKRKVAALFKTETQSPT